jgi:hypothetical protein
MTNIATTKNIQATKPNRDYVRALVALAALLAAGLLALSTLSKAAEGAPQGANDEIVFASSRTTGAGVYNPTGDLEISKMSPDGTGLVQLTRNNISDSDPAFSPDGKQIAFDSLRGFKSEIYTMSSSNGSSQTNLTQLQTAIDMQPDWGATCSITGTADSDILGRIDNWITSILEKLLSTEKSESTVLYDRNEWRGAGSV